MSSRPIAAATLAASLILAAGHATAQQGEHASPLEIIQKVRQAAQSISESGEAALPAFSGESAASVWKDSYVLVLSCEGGTAVTVAHPIRPDLKGVPTARIVTFGPASGERIAADMCAAGGKPRGGWVVYDYPRPGETRPARKVTYVLAARGTPYLVAAGVYDATARVEDLDRLADGP